ncbi:dockerin type I repeat-containing protein [Ruminococcus sp.]|uniref:dockerin type I repeat-containing protein n=1 Tax=Ruminococcus sp. TaxID=41978 RepID=UPI0025E1C1B3|nr:dockerin type I repeat-containing protein [Ruminococcus sp.]
MKFKKRLLSVCTSAALLGTILGAMPTMSVSAVNLIGDVNCDGSVNLSDNVALNRYLNGMCELSNLTNADTNANYVIDVVDSKVLLAFLTGTINTLPY